MVPKSDEALLAQCRVETFRAGGPGGQHQNKTETAVRIVHLPTGISSVARDERSQLRNRHLAITRLREKLEAHNKTPETRRRTMIPKREKKRRLERKRQRSQTKKLRKKPGPDLE
ncbi:MAG TPA: peptide chain release factor-like protein [Gemmatimonadetes bacterium]|nr:peptide chain release factor-like protein [Gemmatimonadota bacterium]